MTLTYKTLQDLESQLRVAEKNAATLVGLENDLVQLERTNLSLETKNKTLAAELKSLEEQFKSVSKEKSELLTGKECVESDLAKENELLLLQLYQVQEELEHYYFKYKEKEAENCFLRSPVVSFERLQLLDLDDELGEQSCLKFIAFGVTYSGKRIGDLPFLLHGEVDSVILKVFPIISTSEDVGEFSNSSAVWYVDKGGFIIDNNGGVGLLLEQSRCNWHLVNAVCDAVLKRLLRYNEGRLGEASSGQLGLWMKKLAQLQLLIKKTSTGLRYDEIRQLESYSAGSYEHIWLELHNFECEGRIYDKYSFKLVLKDLAANGMPGTVALVFRDLDDGISPLYKWPPAEKDDYGFVLNIEFDAVSGEEKVGWSDLWSNDRNYLRRLISSLPQQLRVVMEQGGGLGGRSLEDMLHVLEPLMKKMDFVDAQKEAIDVKSDFIQESELFNYESVGLYENYQDGPYAHIGVRVKNMSYGSLHWPNYDFKLFVRGLTRGVDDAWCGLEFRVPESGLAPLEEWPPTGVEYDDYGAFLLINPDYQSSDLSLSNKKLIAVLLDNLPAWLNSMEAGQVGSVPEWSVWKLLLEKSRFGVVIESNRS